MRIKSGSSVFPRLVGLMEDGKERTIKEIAQELDVTYACVRNLLSDAHGGHMSHSVHISGYRLTKYKQVALFSLGTGNDVKPIEVFRVSPFPTS